MKRFTAMALSAVLAMSMTVYAESEETSEEAVTLIEEEVVFSETEYPVTVYNSDGTEVVIEKEPQTIVSLGPNITEIIYEIGAEDKLAARTDYCDYPAECLELPSIGTLYSPDMEAILALEPDLVVASTHISEDIQTALTEAGIPVLYLYEEHEIEGVYTMIETLGTALNCNDEAWLTVELMKIIMEYTGEALDVLKDEDKLSVYYVVGYGEYGDYTAGGDTFINGILEAAGAVNIAADVEGWTYSVESLLEQDPDVIILAAYAYEDFMNMEPYSELSAVKAEAMYQAGEEGGENRILVIDTNMLDRQGPRNAEAVYEIAEFLYPNLMAEDTDPVELFTEEETTGEAE